MSISAGTAYDIQEIDGALCLVHKDSDRVIMELHLANANIQFSPNDAVTCSVLFYCSEPEK